MAKRDFLSKTQDAYIKWHNNLKASVAATTPSRTATDVTTLAADNTDLNDSISNSRDNARALAKRIKVNLASTATLGEKLQIEGMEDSVDMKQQSPTRDMNKKSGSVLEVGFNKMSAEGVHIYTPRDGDARFTFLASETHSPYVDNRLLATSGKPETRKYEAVFFLGKAEIGMENDVVEATAKP
jgi:hypothetical protein